MTDQYRYENDLMFNSFLEDYFYDKFRQGEHSIEMIFSPKCNEACVYCYLNKTYKKLYPDCAFDSADTLNNVRKLLRWMKKNKFICTLDIFSGELFAQEAGFALMDIIYDEYRDSGDDEKIRRIIIPTNFSFLANTDLERRVRDCLNRFKDIGIQVILSASMDGKYMDDNRPFKGNLDIEIDFVRDDAYYDKVFEFAKEYKFGFHPMIWRKNIKKWKDNFDWFRDMFDKHGIPWTNLYLLPVRDDGWTSDDNAILYDFIKYIIKRAFDMCDLCVDEFVDFVLKDNGFNLLATPFISIGRGIGCGMQTSFAIRMSDLKHFPCHRLMYKDLEIGHFNEEMQYVTEHASLGLVTYGFETKNQPMCYNCPINNICIAGCLGSQFETNGEIFAPIRSVCSMEFAYIKAIVDTFDEIGVLDEMLKYCSKEKKDQLIWLRGAKI